MRRIGFIGSFIGLLAGLWFGIPGWILGPLIGAVLLEYIKDPDFKRAAKIGHWPGTWPVPRWRNTSTARQKSRTW